MPRHKAKATAASQAFWKIAGAGAAFQAGSSAVDSATIVASLVHQMTGNVFAVGAASTDLRLGWLLPQIVVGFLAQRSPRRMPYYIFGTFGRSGCLALIAVLLRIGSASPSVTAATGFLNGMTIGYLGYLMEISPDDRRAYSSCRPF